MERHIADLLKERNITLDTQDPVVQGGFTQVPNFVLKMPDLSVGAKIVYSMFLHYSWHNDSCFPGQDRLAQDIGMTAARVSQLTKELEEAGLVEITRRGQGKTNLYKIKFTVRRKGIK